MISFAAVLYDSASVNGRKKNSNFFLHRFSKNSRKKIFFFSPPFFHFLKTAEKKPIYAVIDPEVGSQQVKPLHMGELDTCRRSLVAPSSKMSFLSTFTCHIGHHIPSNSNNECSLGNCKGRQITSLHENRRQNISI